MGNVIHETVPVLVWADIDKGIADMVRYLNTIPGIRTDASCQGTIGEGGPYPYPPEVTVHWKSADTFKRLSEEFDVSALNGIDSAIEHQWCMLHPKGSRGNWEWTETANG